MAQKKRRRRDSGRDDRPKGKPIPAGAVADIEGWALEAAEVHEVELYEVEVVRSGSNIVRVFLKKPGKPVPGEGVTVDECAQVSRYMETLFDEDERIPERYVLEVSSAGIERALKKPRHWAGAIGEQVRVVLKTQRDGVGVVEGELEAWDAEGEVATITQGEDENTTVELAEVKKAKVTFDFGG